MPGSWPGVSGRPHVSAPSNKPFPFRIEFPPELPISSRAEEIIACIAANQVVVLAGETGSGKTTLLNLIGCIDRPDQGEVIVAGQSIQSLSDDALSDFRARHLGFIFQNFNLVSVLSALENVMLSLQIQGEKPSATSKTIRPRN